MAAGAGAGGLPRLRGAGGADAAPHDHQPVQRHGARRRAGGIRRPDTGGGMHHRRAGVGQLRPAGSGGGIRAGGVVWRKAAGRHVRRRVGLCPDAGGAGRRGRAGIVEVTVWS